MKKEGHEFERDWRWHLEGFEVRKGQGKMLSFNYSLKHKQQKKRI